MSEMTPERAELFLELLTNAGWVDDPDEIIAYALDHEQVPVEKLRTKTKVMDSMIREANALVPATHQVNPNIEAVLDAMVLRRVVNIMRGC